MKYKKHYYTLQDGTYYQFPTTKEVIIDADVILKSKNRIYKNLLINSMKSVKRESVSNRGIEKTSIIVILGHFNHGKTTLLDALGKFTIVEKEVHGITQVIILLMLKVIVFYALTPLLAMLRSTYLKLNYRTIHILQ